MGLFKNNNEKTETKRNPDAVFGFRVLAAGYVLYMEYQTVMSYVRGEATTGIWLLITSLVLLGGCSIYVLISSYLSWRKEKAAMAEEAAQAEEAQTQSEETETGE